MYTEYEQKMVVVCGKNKKVDVDDAFCYAKCPTVVYGVLLKCE